MDWTVAWSVHNIARWGSNYSETMKRMVILRWAVEMKAKNGKIYLFDNILSQVFAWKKWQPVRAAIIRQGLNCYFSYLNDGTGLIK